MKNTLRYLSSFAAPVLLCIVFPALFLWLRDRMHPQPLFNPAIGWLIPGVIIVLAGLYLFIVTVRLIMLMGKGTIMPWDPSRKMVIAGPYQYVRNPMILSLIVLLAGEALVFTSITLALLGLFFLAVNTVYFILSEEPGLEKRFGAEYVEYKQNVPMWLPRVKPWRPVPPKE